MKNKTTVYRTSELTGRLNELELPISGRELITGLLKLGWGYPAEEAFPTLNRLEVQFLLTGVTPEEEVAHYESLTTIGVN